MLKNSVIEITASLEVNSEHPIVAGIVNTAKKRGYSVFKRLTISKQSPARKLKEL